MRSFLKGRREGRKEEGGRRGGEREGEREINSMRMTNECQTETDEISGWPGKNIRNISMEEKETKMLTTPTTTDYCANSAAPFNQTGGRNMYRT